MAIVFISERVQEMAVAVEHIRYDVTCNHSFPTLVSEASDAFDKTSNDDVLYLNVEVLRVSHKIIQTDDIVMAPPTWQPTILGTKIVELSSMLDTR